ncbi:MAG: hypothetical protein IJT34_03250 [Butyrivibrio sp.]|nr:hypothetical protein [Butyrivibrio sp.]
MTTLLEIREAIRNFYTRNETWITYVWKFLLAFFALWLIGHKLGYLTALTGLPILLMASLLCTIMPPNFTVVICAGFILGHLYKLAPQYMIVALVVFLLMFLLYFRFSPRDTIAVMLTPICVYLRIPYVMPIALGLLAGPTSVVSLSFGLIVAYLISYISGSALVLGSTDIEESAAQFQLLMTELLDNRLMWVTIAAFAVTVVVVYLLRKLPVDHSWTIAILAGGVTQIVSLLIGDLLLSTNLSILSVLLGTLLAVGMAFLIEFFVFNLDYTRIERVQFEDDEYYYYVKAVPKMTVTAPDRKVKQISRSPRERETAGDRS